MVKKITTVLFDFDGVITNTEPLYDAFFDKLGEKYNLGHESFAAMVKGTTMKNVINKFLNHLPQSDINAIVRETEDFERQMDFPPVAGALEFIQYLKDNKYKVGMVTSSQDFKMKIALKSLGLTTTFDTEVTSDRITDGKPNPMCYLLAADDLGANPAECIVFEDSYHGIEAGLAAGMKVIGLSTTIAENDLKKKVDHVIPDFSDKMLLINILG
ncbi:MAG: HAD family phosphatase [Prevotella sp.]|jgi:HAD superfamily hydrolase (TIGR01509 family)|nr:HAD family phosphatase [Prevotella sp.]